MNGPEDNEWICAARIVPEFRLDAGFECPDSLPGWLVRCGDYSNSFSTEPPSLPRLHGFVLTSDASGRETELAAHYRRLLQAAAPVAERNAEIRRFQCFDVDLFLTFEDERPLHIELLGAEFGCSRFLARLASLREPSEELYDNLDQGWALRILSDAEEIFTLEWNWEGAEDWKTGMRALRFDRKQIAEQASAAMMRLILVHRHLIHILGEDLWNPLRWSSPKDERNPVIRGLSNLR